jgi:type IV secretory pathway TrbF-like protein
MIPAKNKNDKATGRGNEASENPYLQARGAWIERYGSYVAQAYNWRLIAVLESLALITAIVGLLYIAGQSKFVPYVVAVDKVGLALGVKPAEAAPGRDQRVVHAELANFIINARSVVGDRIVEKANIDAVYAMVAPDTPARGYLNTWYPLHNPFGHARHGSIQVQISAILPVSNASYTVQWIESMRNLRGDVFGKETWEGTFSVAFVPPKSGDEASITANPLGMYVTAINWTKKL